MSNSSLAEKFIQASNYSKGRDGRKIEKITIHHMAGVLSIEQCGSIFQGSRKASSHYGVGKDGRIGQYVDEVNTSWADGNWDSNCKSVTIETSNSSTGGNWPVGDSTLESLIKLVADIAKRNNLGTLVKGKNLTWHSMYASTACPGPYLSSKLDYIVERANAINSVSKPAEQPKPATPSFNAYTVKVTTDCLRIREKPTTDSKINGQITDRGVYTIVAESTGKGAKLWGKLQSGEGWISLDYTSKTGSTSSTSKPAAKEIKVGSKVTIKSSATKYYTGQTIPNWVKGKTYTVMQVESNRVLLKEIMSWVYKSDLNF